MGEIMRAHQPSRGFALLTSLLLLALLSAIAVGTIYLIVSERSVGGNDLQDTVATYGAEAGMEKMMADVGALYGGGAQPTVSTIQGLGGAGYPPVIPGITYNTYSFSVAGGGGPNPGNPNIPLAQVNNISTGPNAGLVAFIIPITLTVDAQQATGADVKMVRNVEVALIPVFQFGIFSQGDLSYFAGPPFSFAGRVFTNGNLFLAANQGPLTFQSKIGAVGQVVRGALANGVAITSGGAYSGTVNIPTTANGCPGSTPGCRAIALTEGSVTGALGSALNASWSTISKTTYNGMIANTLTGVHSLTLPFVAEGYKPNELIRLPWPGEAAGSDIYISRLYSIATIQVLLSDTQTGFPGGASGYPLTNVSSASGTSTYANTSSTPASCTTTTPCYGGVNAAGVTAVAPAQAFAEAMIQTSAGTTTTLPTCYTSAPNAACVYEPGLGTAAAPTAAWAAATIYAAGAAVVYAPGAWYVSLAALNVGNPPSTSPTWWMPMSQWSNTSMYFPAFSTATTYSIGNQVTSGGNNYVSITNGNTNHTPPNAANWAPMYWPAFSTATTYAIGNQVTSGGNNYVSLTNGNTNHTPPNVANWAPAGTNWAPYAAGTAYAAGAAVSYTDGNNYVSLVAANTGHTPSQIPPYTWWQPVGVTWQTYAAGTTYAQGNGVIYTDGKLYVSLQGGNTGNTPSSSPTQWQPADIAPSAGTPRQDFLLPSGNTSGNCVNASYPYTTGNTGAGSTSYNNSTNANCMSLIGGYILVLACESNPNGCANGTGYVDVTKEWLSFGISRDVGGVINPSTNNAILRFEQYRDIDGDGVVDVTEPTGGPGPGVNYTDQNPNKYYPIQIYDAREGQFRDASVSTCGVGGVMGLIELDVHNLQRWLYGTLTPATVTNNGINTNATAQNGYILYFSDRRGMQQDPNAPTVGGWLGQLSNTGTIVGAVSSRLTGAYGFEDLINPTVASGNPNGTLDSPIGTLSPQNPPYIYNGEDSNLNGLLDTWGGANVWTGFMTAAPAAGGPQATVTCMSTARKNRVSGARRALRLVNGSLGNLPGCSVFGGCVNTGGFITGGFTVASENPVYVVAPYNASAATAFGETACAVPSPLPTSTSPASPCHVAASVIADAVTFLSATWVPAPGSGQSLDLNSFVNPTAVGNRIPTAGYFRLAIAAGKNLNFPQPTFTALANCAGCPSADYGTDGGAHNFLRYLENWSGIASNYMGSLVSLFYSEYATGIYKCCNTVYSAPTRNYFFDQDFLNPTLLPPGTPMFRDVDNVGFQQIFTPY
jgi:hypothetical protein